MRQHIAQVVRRCKIFAISLVTKPSLPNRPLGIELAQTFVSGDKQRVMLDSGRVDEAVHGIAVKALGIE